MKKKSTYLCVMCALVISLYCATPVFAVIPPVPWANLPYTDTVDDVHQYTDGSDPTRGFQGDYHDEIDIKSVSIQGLNLTLEFSANITINSSYDYTIYMNTDADNDAEYKLYTMGGGGFSLKRLNDSTYWSGSIWDGSNSIGLSYVVNGTTITFINISKPIPAYLSMQVAVIAKYIGDSPTIYVDFAPNPPGGGSLLFLIILFPLIGLGIALVIIYFRRDVIFD